MRRWKRAIHAIRAVRRLREEALWGWLKKRATEVFPRGLQSNAIDDHLKCLLTGEILVDPVIAADGSTYERATLEARISEGNLTSPATGEPLQHTHLTPDNSLKKLLRDKREGNLQGCSAAPDEFKCAISLAIMRDPVIAADGFTYERSSIEECLRWSNKSPLTNLPMSHQNVYPNTTLRLLMRHVALLGREAHLAVVWIQRRPIATGIDGAPAMAIAAPSRSHSAPAPAPAQEVMGPVIGVLPPSRTRSVPLAGEIAAYPDLLKSRKGCYSTQLAPN
jgi:hypothetical protein